MHNRPFNTNANTGAGSTICTSHEWCVFDLLMKVILQTFLVLSETTAAFTLSDYLWTFFFFQEEHLSPLTSNSLLHFSEKLQLRLLLDFCFLDHTNMSSPAFPHKSHFLYLLSLLFFFSVLVFFFYISLQMGPEFDRCPLALEVKEYSRCVSRPAVWLTHTTSGATTFWFISLYWCQSLGLAVKIRIFWIWFRIPFYNTLHFFWLDFMLILNAVFCSSWYFWL